MSATSVPARCRPAAKECRFYAAGSAPSVEAAVRTATARDDGAVAFARRDCGAASEVALDDSGVARPYPGRHPKQGKEAAPSLHVSPFRRRETESGGTSAS